MSGFELVPVDGGAPVHLPPGETVLGRGPLLGVSDTRVSRHHGLLENLSGQLRLKPTHLNPCFVQSSLTDDPRPLTRGSWYPLHDGDLFSLLPGKLIYKVVAVGEDVGTARNSQILDEEELPGSPLPDVELTHPIGGGHRKTPPHEEPTLAASANTEEQEDRRTHQVDVSLPQEVDDDDGDIAASLVKSRVLPAWMLAAVAAPHTSSSNPKVQTAEKRGKSFTGASDNIKLAASKKATPTDSPAEAGLSEEEEEERPRKKRRKNKPSDEPTVRHHSASNRSEVSEESDRLIEGVRDSVTAISESEEDRELKDEAESVGSKGNSVSVPAASKCQRRTPCPYGKDCYRKNPLHFQECSHPGDTDHEDEGDEDEEAERPECPYGTDCYRKNPQHRKAYKHTKRPARSTRTVPKKTATPDDDDDNDSFINDDSEDLGDDSDWVPPDRDDSDEEDIRRLQREADVFLKKRK